MSDRHQSSVPTAPGPPPKPALQSRSVWLLVPIGAVVLVAVFGGYQLLERYLIAPDVSEEALSLVHLIRGVVAAVVLATVVAWFLLRSPLPGPESAGFVPELPLVDREERRRQHAQWFVQMRWIAVGLTLPLILIAVPVAGILPRETMTPLLIWWGLLVAANIGFWSWARRGGHPQRQILVQIVVDLVVLTGLLNASGGLENPLYIAYVFHVIIAGVLLPKPKVFSITIVAATLVLILAVGEYVGLLPHFTNILFPHDSEETSLHGTAAEHDEASLPVTSHLTGTLHASHDPIFVAGRVLPFMGVLFLTGYLTTLAADRLYRTEMELERTARAALLEYRRLESVVDAAGVGILLRGPDQAIRWASRRGTQWQEHDTHDPDEPCPFGGVASGCGVCLVARTFATKQSQEAERRLKSEDGGLRYLRCATSPVPDRDGNVVQVVELVEDITARKALETQALHAGKLSVLGRMAAGVAHEIGNPLSSLTARLELMERRNDPSFARESITVLRSQIARISRIVHGISHFARPRHQEWERWEINGVVGEALELLRVDRRAKRIEFRERLAVPSPRVRGVRDQIVQVCLNLLLNAVEASPDGAVVEIETAQRNGDVVLAVEDQGNGVTPEVRAHLFEPFFTTKAEGTGLGLSISYAMVHAHDGRIEVSSDPGKGARFAVHLPAAATDQPAT